MRPSVSAAFKFADFFPWCELSREWIQAKRPTRAQRRQIRVQCPVRGAQTFAERGTYWLVSPAGAVFVVAPSEFVVDVFPLLDAGRRR